MISKSLGYRVTDHVSVRNQIPDQVISLIIEVEYVESLSVETLTSHYDSELTHEAEGLSMSFCSLLLL